MVEHLLCKQGVIGSNPIVSITVVSFQPPVERLVRGWRGLHGMVSSIGVSVSASESVGWLGLPCCRWASALRVCSFVV